MQKLYRTEYPGEFVITNTVFKRGHKEQTREWIENPVDVSSHSKRACCIAPYYNERKLPMVRLENHRGGLLGRDRMQLYTVDDQWKKIKTDFTVINEQPLLDEVKQEGYQVDNVIYTTASRCIANPGEFYLIPLGVYNPPIVTIVWLACFDGHKDIFLYGYNRLEIPDKLIFQIRDVMQLYDEVSFHHVTDERSPDAWLRCLNFDTISIRDFISLCDI